MAGIMFAADKGKEIVKMNLPGFHAEASLYKTTAQYFQSAGSLRVSQGVTPQSTLCPSPFMCEKAMYYCRNPGGTSYWCEIADRCFDRNCIDVW